MAQILYNTPVKQLFCLEPLEADGECNFQGGTLRVEEFSTGRKNNAGNTIMAPELMMPSCLGSQIGPYCALFPIPTEMFHMRLIEPFRIAKLREECYFYNERILLNQGLTNLLSPCPHTEGWRIRL